MKRMRFAAIALLSPACCPAALPRPPFRSRQREYQKMAGGQIRPVSGDEHRGDMAGTRPPGFENPKPEVLRLQPQIPQAPGY